METKEHNSGVHQQTLIEHEQTYALNKLLYVIVTLNRYSIAEWLCMKLDQ